MPFGQEGLVVTWSIPVPAEAKITSAKPETSRLMDEVARAAGGEIPQKLSGRYLGDVVISDVFNETLLWSVEDLQRWENRFDIKLENGPAKAFQRYFDNGHIVLGALVNHPEVREPARWAFCSIILQRALVIYAGRRETVIFRSYFHSRTADRDEAVNFVPAHDIEVSFHSDTIWFPLALTQFIAEKEAHVALDILTPRPPRFAKAKEPYRALGVTHRGHVHAGRRLYHSTRLAGALEAGRELADLKLEI